MLSRSDKSLRQLLQALGDPMVEVVAAPRGLDGLVRDVVILDPEDDPDVRPGDVVLLIGVRGRAAISTVRAAARRGALAVAVKGQDEALERAATDAGVALLSVRSDARWEQLASIARANLGAETDSETVGDLFSLAQTIAALTGGLVSIEDTASRVLAYSRSSDEVDELRRLSILGRQGPEQYLAKLREWGVYQRLRESEAVEHIDQRPELGIRRRLAVGVHAGEQSLGTIWVQEGATPLTDQAERALLGAARVTALHLVRSRNNPAAPLRLRESLLEGLLDGHTTAAAVAANIGADATRAAGVVAFELTGDADRSTLELRRAELTNVISVHAAAYRRAACAHLRIAPRPARERRNDHPGQRGGRRGTRARGHRGPRRGRHGTGPQSHGRRAPGSRPRPRRGAGSPGRRHQRRARRGDAGRTAGPARRARGDP
jgi:hypothetical protein